MGVFTRATGLTAGLYLMAMAPIAAAQDLPLILNYLTAPFKADSQPSSVVLATTDAQGRRVTFKARPNYTALFFGGELAFRTAMPGAEVLQRLAADQPVILDFVASRKSAAPELKLILKQRGRAGELAFNGGRRGMTLPLEGRLSSGADALLFQAVLQEEPAAMQEFTVVSYNVENLFDQEDDQRNEGYGDYRIEPNRKGFASNWGKPIQLEGISMSLTHAKAITIAQVLLSIDPMGPEVVVLEEVDSEKALAEVFQVLKDFGYRDMFFSLSAPKAPKTAVGQGIISKFPITGREVVPVNAQAAQDGPNENGEGPRAILKATLNIGGFPLVVYGNHWKAKSGPESKRYAAAVALRRDLDAQLQKNPGLDYMIVGDLNSNYNEKEVLEDKHNDTNGKTGINDVLVAQGDEMSATETPNITYNLHFEMTKDRRRTAYHNGFGWSSFDHIIIGAGLYDQRGITYVDNSFMIPTAKMPLFHYLFKKGEDATNRWHMQRKGHYTVHSLGGYADHLPVVARFRVPAVQDDAQITLFEAGVEDR